MEWRQQTNVSCADAFSEAQRWIEEVTGKSFGCDNFRAALENGVLLCDLINQLKPGIIKRVNRLSTPIAGLDNISVFLKACGKLGLNASQLFHPGDLQDLSTRVTLRRDESTRRLKNVLITIYWLGRKAHLDAFYSGPQLHFKAFEGLLGLALSKSLDEGSNAIVKDGGYRQCRYPEKEESSSMRSSYKKGNSVDSIEFLNSRALRSNSEGCGSDAEAEHVFKMENTQPSAHQSKGYIPTPILRRKQGREETGKGSASPLPRTYQIQVRPERPVQVNPGWIWSKSLSDIPMVYPVRKVPDGDTNNDEGQDNRKCSVAAKDSEAQWQDDLTKWKSRRRSTKSDLRRNSLDREHVINQMTNGAVKSTGGLTKREQQSPWRHKPAPRPYSTSPPSKPLSSDLRPHTRALLARSYAIESPFSPTVPLSQHNSAHTRGSSVGAMPASDGNILGEETYFASVASDGAGATTPSLDQPFSSQTQVKAPGGPRLFQSTLELARPQNVFTNQISTLVIATQPNCTAEPTGNRDPTSSTSSYKPSFCIDPDAVNQAGVDALKDLSYQNHKSNEERQKSSWEPAVDLGKDQHAAGVYKYLSRTGSWSGSASLPRGYRRSEGSARLSSAITARPFGTKQSRVSSLPRLCSVDDNQDVLLNSEKEDSLSPPTKSSFIRQTATAHLKGQNQASVTLEKVSQAKQNVTEQGKEVNGASIPSRASFQNNGYPHLPSTQILPQPYSNLQTSHRNKNATPPSTASTDVPKVDHSDMRVSLTLKPNSVADFGFHTHWDSMGARVKLIQPGSPAELCQLHVDDEIVAVDGVPVTQLNYNQWKDKMASALQTGNLTMDIRRFGNKDWNTSDGSHRSLPGQSRVTLNLTAAAPVLIGCPDHHPNGVASAETAVTKVSKFNGQSDNVIQGKVMGGVLSDNLRTATSKDYNEITSKNQKRRTEFFNQKGGSESAISDLQVPSLSPSTSSWLWDREEDRRRQEKWQEEQERLLQEQYHRDQERLEAEWKRAQQDAMGVSKSGQNTFEMNSGGGSPVCTQLHVNGLTNKSIGEELSPNRGELKDAGGKPQSNVQGLQDDKMAEKDWAKSLSTPVLAVSHKQSKGPGDQRNRKGQSVSKVEQERQQILDEMKKRTQLLTDNSWIRQRSSSFYKEPIYVGVPMKRYDSLDNLDVLRQSPVSPAMFPSYPRPHSAAAGFCAPSRNSCSRYSTGAMLSQRNTSMDPSPNGRMVSGRRTCSVCERVLGSGAAMVIEALSLCFHLACFQCVGCCRHLGGTETGAQVRIRNRKLHCELCYFQLKYTGALPM
ncbi:LIM domain only protein 7-like isoform X2 [Stegastes partitus]|uniref:LIM domain only protein 7-like isoform X2 n=1 Tax=Stegastes partitus TaxID=144197 RepID=A0A9Y4KCM2_9TELE|nr:PREDICTED: LIM domain only protein 7-like isoform X2 [Stegastes partitus]